MSPLLLRVSVILSHFQRGELCFRATKTPITQPKGRMFRFSPPPTTGGIFNSVARSSSGDPRPSLSWLLLLGEFSRSLEARSLPSRCGRGRAPSKASRRPSDPPLPASGGCITPVSLYLVNLYLRLGDHLLPGCPRFFTWHFFYKETQS